MIIINNAEVHIDLTKQFYKTIINARRTEQTKKILNELGEPKLGEWANEYEISKQVLLLLWE